MTLRQRIEIAEKDMADAIMSEHAMAQRVAALTEICNGLDAMRCELAKWKKEAGQLKKQNATLKASLTRFQKMSEARK